MKNKKNLKRTALVVLSMLLGHFVMNVFETGVKDGQKHAHQTQITQPAK